MKKFFYSLGAVAAALSFQTLAAYIVFFYVDVMKLPPALAAIGMLIYGVWNAVNDPLFGYLSDHTSTRWGRRTPYIALGAIPLGLFFFLLWVPPFTDYSQSGQLFAYFVVMICLFDGFYSLTIINWSALFPEMFSSLKERAQVNSWRQAIGLIMLIFGVALPPLIYSRWGWGWLGVFFGSAITLSVLISLLGIKEKPAFSSAPQLRLWPSLVATLKNRSFLTLVGANLLTQYAFLLILATIPFFSKYLLLAKPEEMSGVFAAAFIAALPGLFIWRRLTENFGAKRCFLYSLAVMIAALLIMLAANNLTETMLASAIVGLGASGFLLLIDLLLSDVIDEDETRTGGRREGLYFGANAFFNRFAIALEVVSIGGVFMLAGYNRFVFAQPPEFLLGLRLLLAGLPLLALTLAFVLILFYPLGGKRLEQLSAEIEKIHQRKGVK